MESTGPAFSEKSKSKNIHENKSLNTRDEVVEDLIAQFPLEADVGTANLEEYVLRNLELTVGKYLRYNLDNMTESVDQKLKEDCLAKSGDKSLDEVDTAAVILREFWKRLRETHKLRVVE